jgi:two-component system, cell cycle sensor histidine kinase and response regulator CckA
METNSGTPRRRHVVIVDDNAELAWFFSEILKLHGYDSTVLSDAVQALKYVLSHHTDVVICDLQMPQLDGDLFYATVERANPGLARRFVFITGVADEARFHTFVSTVDAPVLRKPVAVETLLSEIERIIR